MSHSKLYLRVGVAVVLLTPLVRQSAYAQMDGPYPNLAPSTMNAYMSSHISNLSIASIVRKNQVRKGRGLGASPTTKASTRPVRSGSTTYRATPAVTQKVIKQYLAWARTQSPQEANTLKATFARYNPVQIWSQVVKEDGLKTGDVADALAAYWVLNYLIAHRTTQSTRAQALAVRNQVRPLLASNPRIARLSSAQKQEIAEIWMVNFVVQQGAFSSAMKSQNKALLQKMSDAAVTRFQNELGVNLRQVNLTNQGFVAV